VIVKRIIAHSKKAHQMAIVYNPAGLAAVSGPCVVQQFINHGAAMIKVCTLARGLLDPTGSLVVCGELSWATTLVHTLLASIVSSLSHP
jgi:fucose permease